MTAPLERVSLGVWGDRARDILHVDVRELQASDRWAARRTVHEVARQALGQLRRAGVSGIIIARLRGIGARGQL